MRASQIAIAHLISMVYVGGCLGCQTIAPCPILGIFLFGVFSETSLQIFRPLPFLFLILGAEGSETPANGRSGRNVTMLVKTITRMKSLSSNCLEESHSFQGP